MLYLENALQNAGQPRYMSNNCRIVTHCALVFSTANSAIMASVSFSIRLSLNQDVNILFKDLTAERKTHIIQPNEREKMETTQYIKLRGAMVMENKACFPGKFSMKAGKYDFNLK